MESERMNEIEKMRNGLLADFTAPEVQESFRHCKTLLARFRTMSTYDADYRSVLEQLIPGIPATTVVVPPFHCDHGHGIRLGEHVYINAGCTFLDGACITIGDYTLIAPNVQIYTAFHPTNAVERFGEPKADGSFEFCKTKTAPVIIGDNVWIGGGAIILPGVTIGNSVVIGAGSVVTKNIPDNVIAAGSPCRVIRRNQ